MQHSIKKLSELQDIINGQSGETAQKNALLSDQEKQIARLYCDANTKEEAFGKQAEELKRVKEAEYRLQTRSESLESQLSGSVAARYQLEADATVIGELKGDVDGLRTALSIAKRNNEGLQKELQQSKDTIYSLRDKLLQSQEQIQGMKADIVEQCSRVDIAEVAVKSVEAKAIEAEAKAKEAISNAGSVVPATPIEESGLEKDTLQFTMLDILTVDNFLPRKQKIFIIGGTET